MKTILPTDLPLRALLIGLVAICINGVSCGASRL
jgi:hypothetical protein